MTTPEKLKRLRELLGITQKELAEIFYKSVRTVEDWEQGRRTPHEPVMNKVEEWIDRLEEKEN